ncbi:MAG TPA: SGNH/GDSL hydrolase family protein [bacterium]|nr:SGNH/GDSL hydrolase family protein [bacterium]HPP29572.1 SGNH/GDSL hydrolase family protein [bacterium]
MKKIYVVGDSISIHYGPYLENYLKDFAFYSRKEDKDDPELGANGGDSSAVLRFLEQKLNSGGIDADIILINCGLHDIKTDPATGKKQVPPEQYRKNLYEILSVIRKLKAMPVWIRTTPCDERIHNREGISFYRFSSDVKEYNGIADEIMQKNNVPVIDLYTFTLNSGKDLYCDHVHFNEHIREKQAAFIAGWLCGFITR